MYNTLKRTVLISLAALLLLPVFVAAFPSTVQAAPYSDDTVQEKAEAWLFARALSKCFRESLLKNGFNNDLIDEGNAKEGKWFYNDLVNTSSHDLGIIVASIVEGNDADDGSLECSWGDDNVVDETLSRLGLDPIEALCGMGSVWKRENPGSTPGEACQSGSGHFDTDDEKSDKIQEAWNDVVRKTYLEGKGLQDSLTDAMRYWISLETFRIGCKADFKAIYDNQSVAGDKKYKTPLYNKETGEIEQWYVETQKGNDVIVVGGNGLFDSDSKQHCATLEENLDKYIDAYVAAMKAEKELDPDGTQTGSAPQPVCEADGFGWVICPLINMMAQITETVAEFLDDYLRIQPLTTDTDSVLYKGWSNIVGIANILLIIAFIFIVFSQVTSIGIGNYGIKKLLPRIIAAAILINISYFICAILVDLSNITGSAISNLIYSNLGGISGDAQEEGFVGGVKNVAGNVAAGLIGVSGLVIVAFFFLIPAVVAILSIFVVLAARTAIITLLIIIAPLAFAAWILPNTDKWFRKWWDIFLQMLVVYPAIMAIFAASTAAASIVVDSTGASAGETPGPGNLFPLLIGLLIQALPLFALPALIKLSSGVLARLDTMTRGGRFAKAGQGFFEKARDRRVQNVGARMASNSWQGKDIDASTRRGRALQRTQRRLGQTSAFTGGYKARRDFMQSSQKSDADRLQQDALARRLQDDNSSLAARSTLRGSTGQAIARARGVQIQDKMIGEEVSAAKTVIENMEFSNAELAKLATTGNAANLKGESLSGDFYQKAAQQQLISTGQVGHVYKMLENAQGMSDEVRESMSYHLGQNYSVLKAKDHTLNDDDIKAALVTGGGNVTPDMLGRASLSKLSGLTKDVFSGQDVQGIKNLESGIKQAQQRASSLASSQSPADIAERQKLQKQIENAYAVASSAYSDPTLEKNFSVESRKATEELLRSMPSPPPPPAVGGGTP